MVAAWPTMVTRSRCPRASAAELYRMHEVDDIVPVRARRITAAWAEQKIVREIMVFLHVV